MIWRADVEEQPYDLKLASIPPNIFAKNLQNQTLMVIIMMKMRIKTLLRVGWIDLNTFSCSDTGCIEVTHTSSSS